MKTVLFVPGFQEGLKSRDYTSTIKAIESAGYRVKFVPIHWPRTTIDDWIQELEAEYAKHDPKQTILAGFSFGAMTAFTVATRTNPVELWLFSLSPYFNEDIHSKNMKQSWLNNIGHRRVTAFDRLNFESLATTIHCKTLIFAGKAETDKWPDMKNRTLAADKLINDSTLSIIDGVGHDVADPLYIDAIEKVI